MNLVFTAMDLIRGFLGCDAV